MAKIYSADGNILTDGLQGSEVCDEAIRAAQNMARDHGKVILEDDDGSWLVRANGEIEEFVW